MNRADLIGNVGRDPEFRTFPDGGKVANFSIATVDRWRDKQTGKRKEKTEWHNIAVFNDGLVGVIEQYVHKGDKIRVSGKIRTREYQDKDGNRRRATEVVLEKFGGELELLSSKRDDSEADTGRQTGRQERPASNYGKDLDEDIPY